MRTAIFVYEPSELSIDTSEHGVNLEKMNGGPRALGGLVRLILNRGVYRVISKEPIKVSIDGKVKTEVDIVTGDLKDPVPKPRPQIAGDPALGATALQAFDRAFADFFPVVLPSND
ncbi:MAG: hypothetical protein ABIY55_20500 [Kofleriaceae bacterium]